MRRVKYSREREREKESGHLGMIVEVILAVVLCGVYWYFNVRIPSAHRRLVQVTASTAVASTWDYVIVGGGVSGAAAARAVAVKDPNSRVLLIERGGLHEGGMVAAPAFTLDLVGTDVDARIHQCAAFPLESGHRGTNTDATAPATVPYAMGRCLGGTQQLDWSLVFEPLSDAVRRRCPRSAFAHGVSLYERMRVQHSSFAVCRSPLSWAFAEAAKFHKSVTGCFLPGVSSGEISDPNGEPQPLLTAGHVSPHVLWMEPKYGTRPNLSRYLLDDVSRQRPGGPVAVLLHGVVVALEGGPRAVTHVVCRDALGGLIRIPVSRSVILCAGNFGSCHLALRSALLPKREWPKFPLCDAVCVPLLYQAKPGLSDDILNTQSIKQIFAWYVASRGSLLNCVADTSILMKSERHPGGTLLVTLVPCGGYQTHRFAKMGLSRALGVFQEALMFNIAIHQLPPPAAVEIDPPVPDAGDDNSEKVEKRGVSTSSISSFSFVSSTMRSLTIDPMSPDAAVTGVIRDMLIEGISLCRELVAGDGPLKALSTQKEALDTTLFPDESEGKAACRVLYGKLSSATKQKQKMLDPHLIARIRDRAVEVATSREYLEQYVTRHSRFAGFACGSLADAVEPHGFRLKGTDNVFVGDSSSVPGALAVSSGVHRGACTSTAMLLGTAAAIEATAVHDARVDQEGASPQS